MGLFSTEIFGKVGEERRNRMFAYIDMKIEIFHPVIYNALSDLKHIYPEIIAGKAFAVWNKEIMDFERSDPGIGETGYSFFIKHFKDIKHVERDSAKREFNIQLVKKYLDNCTMSKILVMPAGVRDFEVDENGKPSDNEINDFYRKIMILSNLVTPSAIKLNPESFDRTRNSIQLAVNSLYEYIISLLEGKKKFVQGKWASRNIANSTRNVITAVNAARENLDDPNAVSTEDTVTGLYQFVKGILPVTMNALRSGFLSRVFQGPNTPAILVNKKTLKKEMVNIDPAFHDDWMTDEGLEKMLTRFGEEALRHLPLEVANYYMGLTYIGPDNTFAFFQDIDDLPKEFSKENVFPLTYAELLYGSIYPLSRNVFGFITRYPIANYGSIYPSKVYLKTTVKAVTRYELDSASSWTRKDTPALEFPIRDTPFVNSMSPSTKHLGKMAADFDGDTCSLTLVYSEEATAEVKKKLRSRNFHVDSQGKLYFGSGSDTVNYILKSITG